MVIGGITHALEPEAETKRYMPSASATFCGLPVPLMDWIFKSVRAITVFFFGV
jgi:hypothetical protein